MLTKVLTISGLIGGNLVILGILIIIFWISLGRYFEYKNQEKIQEYDGENENSKRN